MNAKGWMLILLLSLFLMVGAVSASTIGDAIKAAPAGSTVTIDPGTTWKEHSITINKPITLIGNGVTIDCLNEGGAFRIISTSGVTIEGFEIINTPTEKSNDVKRAAAAPRKEGEEQYDDGAVSLTPAITIAHAGNIVIKDVTITETSTGISIYNTHSAQIGSNTITGAIHNGIEISGGSTGITVAGNTITGANTAITTMGSFSSPTVAIDIRDNTITDSTVDGIYIGGMGYESVIEKNTVKGSGGIGVYVDYTTRTGIIKENEFENSGGTSRALKTGGDVHVAVPKTGLIFSSFDIKDNVMKDAPGGVAKGIFDFFGWGVIQYDR